MRSTTARRSIASLAMLLTAGLALTACGEDDGGSNSAGGTSPGEGKAECEGLTGFGDLTGKKVKVYTSIVAPEDDSQKDSYELFTDLHRRRGGLRGLQASSRPSSSSG